MYYNYCFQAFPKDVKIINLRLVMKRNTFLKGVLRSLHVFFKVLGFRQFFLPWNQGFYFWIISWRNMFFNFNNSDLIYICMLLNLHGSTNISSWGLQYLSYMCLS